MKTQYKQKYVPNHPHASTNGLVYEHILVAEQKLGRHLRPKEVVHHIDGNKRNNAPENLMVFATDKDHLGYHKGDEIFEINSVWYAIRKQTVRKQCQYCGKSFEIRIGEANKGQQYCSHECASRARGKIDMQLDELQKILFSYNGNFTAVAKLYSVSANALVKQLKTHGFPYHSGDYKSRN